MFNTDAVRKTIERTTATMTLLVSMIALISLMVGGIGVMNIMLVSVTERTREIGVRMAVGARRGDIMQQFLIEAVLVCLIGGMVGIALSLGLGVLVSKATGGSFRMIYSSASMVAAFTCSTLIGVLFGYLPARNARAWTRRGPGPGMRTMRVSMMHKPAALALLLALSGCGGLLRTDYQRPEVREPAAWTRASGESAAGALAEGGAWWRNFSDPELNRLVELALARNNDLAVAAIKLQRAQYQAGLADDKLIPQPGLTANTSRLRNLRGDRGSASKYGVELNVQYEVDLWGKLSRQSDAAQWEALATEQDRQSAALSLVGTTATLYWQTGFINQRIATSLESIAAARKTQELVRAQYAAGGASALEVAEAAQTVASQVAAHAVLVQQRVEYVNALAILFDGPPDRTMSDPPRLPQAPLPMARAGVPAGCWDADPTCARPSCGCARPVQCGRGPRQLLSLVVADRDAGRFQRRVGHGVAESGGLAGRQPDLAIPAMEPAPVEPEDFPDRLRGTCGGLSQVAVSGDGGCGKRPVQPQSAASAWRAARRRAERRARGRAPTRCAIARARWPCGPGWMPRSGAGRRKSPGREPAGPAGQPGQVYRRWAATTRRRWMPPLRRLLQDGAGAGRLARRGSGGGALACPKIPPMNTPQFPAACDIEQADADRRFGGLSPCTGRTRPPACAPPTSPWSAWAASARGRWRRWRAAASAR